MVGKLSGKSDRKPRQQTEPAAEKTGHVPNPESNLILADISLRAASQLAHRALKRKLLSKYGRKEAKAIAKGGSIGKSLTYAIIARVAARSVPGAVLIGAGFLAKALLDKRRSPKDESALTDETDGS